MILFKNHRSKKATQFLCDYDRLKPDFLPKRKDGYLYHNHGIYNLGISASTLFRVFNKTAFQSNKSDII